MLLLLLATSSVSSANCQVELGGLGPPFPTPMHYGSGLASLSHQFLSLALPLRMPVFAVLDLDQHQITLLMHWSSYEEIQTQIMTCKCLIPFTLA